MRKILYIISFILVLLVGFLGITYSYEDSSDNVISFELIGDSVLYVDVNTEYVEHGVIVFDGNVNISDNVNIDSSLVNVNVIGEYKVKYEMEVDGSIEYIYRIVRVVDKVSPIIRLKGDSIVKVMLGDDYIEDGYIVYDNYDVELEKMVSVYGIVDTDKVGEYELKYKVFDSSGNEDVVTRKVIVYE